MRKKMGKADFFMLGLLAVAFVLVLVFFLQFESKDGEKVVVSLNGETYGVYDLHKDRKVSVKVKNKTINVIEIKNGKAFMKYATCPDKLCEKQKAISKENETIVCLPNKVIVTIKGAEDSKKSTSNKNNRDDNVIDSISN